MIAASMRRNALRLLRTTVLSLECGGLTPLFSPSQVMGIANRPRLGAKREQAPALQIRATPAGCPLCPMPGCGGIRAMIAVSMRRNALIAHNGPGRFALQTNCSR